MYKLDLKDKRILCALDENARQNYSQIARKVGLSKEVVRYRIENLIKNKVISGFLLIVDSKRLNLFYSKAFVTLQDISEKEKIELMNYLINHRKVVAVSETEGKYDLFFSIIAKDIEELNKTLSEIENRFGKYFHEKVVNTILQGYYFLRNYLIDKKSVDRRLIGFGMMKDIIELDEIDKKILLLLSYEPRKSLVDISKNVKLSADGVNLRIKKLEKRGLIQNYTLILNNNEIGQFHYKILLDLKNFTEQSERSLLQFCEQHTHIYYACKTLTPWKFEIDIEVGSNEEYRQILQEIKNKFSAIIKETTSLQTFKLHKYNLLPSL